MLSKTDAPDGVSNGEILKNSRAIFMGYHGEKKKTIEAFTEDFWFRTGDIGAFDPSGNLTISGRLKEIIITAGGKNVAPIPIEDNIKEALKAVVSNVVVVGEKKKYLTSLLTLRVQVDPVTLLPTDKLDTSVVNWAKIQGCPGLETIDDFINGPHAQTLRASVERSFKLVNSRSESNVTKVQKFAILPQEFSVPSGELGPTLKLKRFFVYDKYASYIDAMYDAVEEQVEVEKKKEQLTKADNLVLNPVAA